MLRNVFFGAVLAFIVTVGGLFFILPNSDAGSDAALTSQVAGDQLSEPQESTNSFVIRNVQVFDGAKIIRTSIVVQGGIIVDLGADISMPDELMQIDASGQTLLPGLIDAHTHSYGNALADALRFGVTTNLDMFTIPSVLSGKKAIRESMSRTSEADIFSSATLVTVPGGHGTEYGIAIDTLTRPDQAQAFVDARIAEGADYIKIVYIPNDRNYPTLDRPTAKALIEAAHARGLLAMAHISTLQAAHDVVEDGIDGLVHVFADKPVTPEFIELAAERKIFLVPTLSVIASVSGNGLGNSLIDDPQMEPFIGSEQRASLTTQFPGGLPGYKFDLAMANTVALHEAGIVILAGSDAPNPGTAHGATIHSEMALLVKAGLAPAEALASATRLPAEIFSLKDRGLIEIGRRADFVLVEGNPTNDIRATRSIRKIFKNGYEVPRTQSAVAKSVQWTLANLGDFETGLGVEGTVDWTVTTDELANGKSTVSVKRIEGGAEASAGAMKVEASVNTGFVFPWAGALLPLSADFNTGRDVSEFAALSFDVRGTQGTYRAMIFSTGGGGIPPTVEFAVTREWETIRLPLAGFYGLDPKAVTAIALVAGPQTGVYDYDVDNVRFEEE